MTFKNIKFALPIRFGIATSGSLIAYFLILALIGKHTEIWYSLFNGVITGFGIFEAIRFLRIQEKERFNYGMGFTAGIVVGFMATLIFTIFFAIYCTELDPDFLRQLMSQWFSSFQDFEGIVFFTVAIMGFATTIVLTLSFMQLFKSSRNLDKKSA